MKSKDECHGGYRTMNYSPTGQYPWTYRLGTIGSGRWFFLWNTHLHNERHGMYVELDAPEHVRRAFRAGEPVEPIIDYLIEQYADAHPWLHDLARAAVESA